MAVTSILLLVCFIYSTQALLLPLGWVTPNTIYKESLGKCIPTTTSRGPCIICVCNIDGVYICRGKKCSQRTDPIVQTLDCQSNMRYIKDHTVCTCSGSGRWLTENCRKVFRTLRTDLPIVHGNLRSNVTCKPNSLYLIDCNVCKCDKTGLIQATSCTNRHCKTANKADACLFGDFLRTQSEICLCSDVNYYIDKLCGKISPDLIQELNTNDVKSVTDVGFKSSKKCTAFREYYVDCNHCICDENGKMLCTKKDCRPKKIKSRRASDDVPTVQSVNDVCTPGQRYKLKCNTCVCTPNEELSCTTMVCLEDFIIDGLALQRANLNFTNFHLPEIHEGQSCVVGHLYKAGCNTCRCGLNNVLMCTKMACMDQSFVKSFKKRHWRTNNNKNGSIARSGLHGSLTELDESNSKSCGTPGKVVKKGCQICFCSYLNREVCTESCQDRVGLYKKSKVRKFPFKSREIVKFPTLSSLSDKCEPGRMYRIDCNGCLCQESNNLVCEEKLCLSKKGLIQMEAKKLSGKKCHQNSTNGCVECNCVDQITVCKGIQKCEEREKLTGHASKVPLTLNPNKEKCVPGTTYTVQCNQCHCQSDSTLRCTQKTCLNYAQALKLEKQRLHLEKHGL